MKKESLAKVVRLGSKRSRPLMLMPYPGMNLLHLSCDEFSVGISGSSSIYSLLHSQYLNDSLELGFLTSEAGCY